MPKHSTSFPFIRQRDAMQCGVACLTMIAQKFGIRCFLEDIEDICVATSEGVSLKAIADGAKSLGIKTFSAKSTIAHLAEMRTPCVLHWEQKHFVVLYHIDKDATRFWIADPAKGKYKISMEQLQSHWASTMINNQPAGIAIFFFKPSNPPTDKRPHSSINASIHTQGLKFLWQYIIQYKHFFPNTTCFISWVCIATTITLFNSAYC